MKRTFFTLALILVLGGCVSSAKYAELENQYGVELEKNKNLVDENGKLMESLGSLSSISQTERDQFQKELISLHQAAEKRNEEYKNMMSKLKSMIDSGSLSVSVRKGRMIVSLPSDILFPPGGILLSAKGKETLVSLAETLKTIKDRSFLVIGHSDSTPIKTARFPSNWELSASRAISVVELLVENGVEPKILSAAGNAEFDPITDNATENDKQKNRRVEIVFLPNIAELG